jgi:hypothetical protein
MTTTDRPKGLTITTGIAGCAGVLAVRTSTGVSIVREADRAVYVDEGFLPSIDGARRFWKAVVGPGVHASPPDVGDPAVIAGIVRATSDRAWEPKPLTDIMEGV